MTTKTKLYPVATALRNAGYIPLPRLWVRPDDIPVIHNIANQYSDDVNEIRAQANADYTPTVVTVKTTDPKKDIDAAWAAYEQGRQ